MTIIPQVRAAGKPPNSRLATVILLQQIAVVMHYPVRPSVGLRPASVAAETTRPTTPARRS